MLATEGEGYAGSFHKSSRLSLGGVCERETERRRARGSTEPPLPRIGSTRLPCSEQGVLPLPEHLPPFTKATSSNLSGRQLKGHRPQGLCTQALVGVIF